jgi:hypothetical protein
MGSITELLFHTPWWLPVAIFAVGIFIFVSGNRRQEKGTRRAGLIILLAAFALIGVSYFVDTDLEKCVKQSRQLVSSLVARDWKTCESLMSPNCAVSVVNFGQIYPTRQKILDGAKAAFERYGLKSARIMPGLEAVQNDALITVSIDVLSEQDATGYPITSGWQLEWLEWSKFGKEWKLTNIVNIKIGNQTGQGASGQFPR